MKDKDSRHYDDAAYFSGWLLYNSGDLTGALQRFELAISLAPPVGFLPANDEPWPPKVDYDQPAIREVGRILMTFTPKDALDRVTKSDVLSQQPKLWYIALDSLYIAHQHQAVLDGARAALHKFNIAIETLPVTTDPVRIHRAFTKLHLGDETDLQEIVYLYNAALDAKSFNETLSKAADPSGIEVERIVKEFVIKYSLTTDSQLSRRSTQKGIYPRHKDLREGVYLAQTALELVPKTRRFYKLRDWLHYKRITLLAIFDPTKLAAANAEFAAEFPSSVRLNDALAEQVFGEAVTIGDMARATLTFNTLIKEYPAGNAVDNAYSWMAIGWTCVGQPSKAREVNKEIVRLFPLTRHAIYARRRLRESHMCADMPFQWDYSAMNWRQRNRIDLIQHSLTMDQR